MTADSLMRTCVIAITEEGKSTADRIAASLENCTHIKSNDKVGPTLQKVWALYNGFICVMAAGIAVRSIANLIQDKKTDPCVVVTDQKGAHVISLLSGHLGGGNELAHKVAAITGGTAVITTATDVLGKTAIDLWARRNELYIPDREKLTKITSDHVNGKDISVYSTLPLKSLPPDFSQIDTPELADIVITYNKNMTINGLCCIAKQLYLGIGCNRGTPFEEIERSFNELCVKEGFSAEAVGGVATIDVKADEKGILEFAENHDLPLYFYSRDELNSVQNVSYSEAVMNAVGAKGVSEPASYLLAASSDYNGRLKVNKIKWKNVTFAVSERMKNIWD